MAHLKNGPKDERPVNGPFEVLAEWTGLEPATPGVTGRYSNQLNYHSMYCNYWNLHIRRVTALAAHVTMVRLRRR